MQRVKFVASEPMTDIFENEGPEMSEEELVKAIEQTYPEISDVQIIDIETEING